MCLGIDTVHTRGKRTSLISHRTRRVKCDEAKPSCLRCMKFGVECEGYARPVQPQETSRNLRKLLPHDQSTIRPQSHGIHMVSYTSPFRDTRQHSYFHHFKTRTASILSDPFDEGLWNSIILPSSLNEPIVMHLISAIGGLDKSAHLLARDETMESAHHRAGAFNHYSMGFKEAQKLLQKQQHLTPRTMPFASLLIYCFECMAGNIESAETQAASALKMLQKQILDSRGLCSFRQMHPPSSFPDPGVEKAVLLALIRVDAGLSSCPASPVAAKRVDYQPLLHINYNDELDHLPTQFSDMLEA